MQAFGFWAPAAFSSTPGSTLVLGRGGPRSCQRKQANCSGAWFIIHKLESWKQGLPFLVTFPGLYLWGSLGLVNLVGEKGNRVLTSQEEMSRLWCSFCKARMQSSPDSGWKKRKSQRKPENFQREVIWEGRDDGLGA